MSKLKTYNVSVWVTEYGQIEIEAVSSDKAEQKAYDLLEEKGSSVIEKINDIDYGIGHSELRE